MRKSPESTTLDTKKTKAQNRNLLPEAQIEEVVLPSSYKESFEETILETLEDLTLEEKKQILELLKEYEADRESFAWKALMDQIEDYIPSLEHLETKKHGSPGVMAIKRIIREIKGHIEAEESEHNEEKLDILRQSLHFDD